jgi:hypothetical protein
MITHSGARGVGQVPDLSTLGPGLMYVQLATPLGTAVIDPFAAAQDATTQAIMQRLGIQVTIGFGPAPAPDPASGDLFANLSLAIPLALGAIAFLIRPKLSTLAVVGGGLLLWKSGALAKLLSTGGA